MKRARRQVTGKSRRTAGEVGRRVRTLGEFVTSIDEITTAWCWQRNEQFGPWFRGHADAGWTLVPTIFRGSPVADYEDDYRHDFKLKAYPYLAGTGREPTNEWEWYFLMQHYGLPTRLLDWTEGALQALYFALREASPSRDAAVWMTDPWQVNEVVGQSSSSVFIATSEELKPYLWPPYADPDLPERPMALQPVLNSVRITAQRGVFTIHGKNARPLEAYPELTRIAKLIVDGESVADMLDELSIAGVSETTVFPELAGLCRQLLFDWRPGSRAAEADGSGRPAPAARPSLGPPRDLASSL